jgi:hypothetical protein
VASAPNVIAETPEQVVVDSRNSPTDPVPTNAPGSDPAPTTAPTVPGNSTDPAPKGAVTTIEGLADSEFALSSAANIDADRNGATLLVANGTKLTSLTVQSTTQVGGANEAADGNVLAVAASGANRYYLTSTKIVKPSGAVTLSGVSNPSDFVVNGNFAYVTSEASHVVYKVDLTTGAGTVFAGVAGSPLFTNGNAAATRFKSPRGITFSGNALYVADSGNRVIRKLTLDGTSSTFSGSGQLGNGDGEATAAAYRSPVDLTADAAGNLYVVDSGAGVIRKVSSAGAVTTIAGNGNRESLDGTGAAASFRDPSSIALGTLGGHPILFVGQDDAQIRVVQNW